MNTRVRPAVMARLLALPVLLWVLAYGLISLDLPNHPPGDTVSRDFGVYYAAAERLRDGGTPYPTELEDEVDTNTVEPYLYPPPIVFFLQAATVVPQQAAAWIWFGLGIIATAAAAWLALRAAGAHSLVALAWGLAGAFAYFPVQENLRLGNVSALMMLGTAIALNAGARWRGSGVAVAALVKVFPATMGLPLLVRHGWRGLVAAAIAALLISAPSLLLRPDIWLDFVGAVTAAFGAVRSDYLNSLAPGGFIAARWPELPALAEAARLVSFVAAASLLLLSAIAARREAGWAIAVTAAAMAGLLVPGIMWNHFAALLVPAAIVAFVRAGPAGRMGLLLLVAPLMRVGPFFAGSAIAFVSFWASCALVLVLLWPRSDEGKNS